MPRPLQEISLGLSTWVFAFDVAGLVLLSPSATKRRPSGRGAGQQNEPGRAFVGSGMRVHDLAKDRIAQRIGGKWQDRRRHMPAGVAGDLAIALMVLCFPRFRGEAKNRQTSVGEDVGRNLDRLERGRVGGRMGIGKSEQQKRKAAENAQPYLSNLPKTPDHLAYQLIMQPKVIMSYGNPCNALQPRGHCDARERAGRRPARSRAALNWRQRLTPLSRSKT